MEKKNPHKAPGNFKVPEGYFESFEERLFEKIGEENMLPADDGFSVPANYFEGFEDRLFQKLHEKKEPKVIRLSTYKKVLYAVASTAAVLVLFITTFKDPGDDRNYDITDIENYIENGYMALNTYDIAEVFEEETLEITSLTEDNIEDEKLIDYLHENLDSYEDLAIEN